MNVTTGPRENRLLLTGLHVVADIYCNCCDTRLGWKYVRAGCCLPARAPCARPCAVRPNLLSAHHLPTRPHAQVEAFEETQKYKEGKFILEKAMISKEEERQLHRFVEQELPIASPAGRGGVAAAVHHGHGHGASALAAGEPVAAES